MTVGTGIGESFTVCDNGDMRGRFRPPALPEDYLVFLFFVSRCEGKHMKAMTFDKSFAENK